MKLWLDTTCSKSIKKAKNLGILFGITTNPSIIADSGQSFSLIIQNLLTIQDGPVAVQVIAQDLEGMLDQAAVLRKISERIIIKIPVSEPGLEAIRILSNQQVPVMATTVFKPHQAYMAAALGAKYVAPYIGQIEKNGENPWDILTDIIQIYKNETFATEILAASIPTIDHFNKCALLNIPHITFKGPIFQQLIQTIPATQDWMDRFSNNWEKANLSFKLDTHGTN